jgi:hypothetical protein
VTADPATNALVIQASQEGYATIAGVIEKLDIERPQVLVEALIMEVDVTDGKDLGFNGLYRLINGDTDITIAQVSDSATKGLIAAGPGGAAAGAGTAAIPFLLNFFRRTFDVDANDLSGSGYRSRISSAPRLGRGHNIACPASHPGQRRGGDPDRQQHPDHQQPRADADLTTTKTRRALDSVNVERCGHRHATPWVTPQITGATASASTSSGIQHQQLSRSMSATSTGARRSPAARSEHRDGGDGETVVTG